MVKWDASYLRQQMNELEARQNSILYSFIVNRNRPITKYIEKSGSIIFVVGKSPIDIMEPILL
ncbi:hypothetical protein SP4011_09010 [Streptococcus parapneumoniae]|uniref:Uncharacterized protein n=1 Tax=Streptococcus parapneumoniae TaxID=2993430 RepID=A0ABM8CG88_9STRE|nr:hypothetical protein SP4011_09010 [Streptococcus sp. SP4011]